MSAFLFHLLERVYQICLWPVKRGALLLRACYTYGKQHFLPTYYRVQFFLGFYALLLHLLAEFVWWLSLLVARPLIRYLELLVQQEPPPPAFFIDDHYYWLTIFLVSHVLLPILSVLIAGHCFLALAAAIWLTLCPAYWKARAEAYFQATLEGWEEVTIILTPSKPLPPWLAVRYHWWCHRKVQWESWCLSWWYAYYLPGSSTPRPEPTTAELLLALGARWVVAGLILLITGVAFKVGLLVVHEWLSVFYWLKYEVLGPKKMYFMYRILVHYFIDLLLFYYVNYLLWLLFSKRE